jgi:hypothetical protein
MLRGLGTSTSSGVSPFASVSSESQVPCELASESLLVRFLASFISMRSKAGLVVRSGEYTLLVLVAVFAESATGVVG